MGFGDTPMMQIRVYEFAKTILSHRFVTCDMISMHMTKIVTSLTG